MPDSSPVPSWLSEHAPLLVAVALLLLSLLGCNRGLWTPDEPREAEISREMLLAPSVIPTLNGARFIEKPPLYYWTVAGVFRLTGGPSVLAARAVSVVAALATLWLLYTWLAQAHSRTAGLLAAGMLATGLQFAICAHWVLLDPLLMLSTTVCLVAAWRLWNNAHRGWLWIFYLGLLAALWIKGPIGPLLIVIGLLVYGAVDRADGWRQLRPALTLSALIGAGCLLALALYLQGGWDTLWEWGYVNHVKRLLSPGNTGHRQPLLYYLWTLPYAVLPWAPVLLLALVRARWRRAPAGEAPQPQRYAALMGGGMVLLLSLSATKRETYLLPALPLLSAWLALVALKWWRGWQARGIAAPPGGWWWSQLALLALWCLAAPLAALIWTRQPRAQFLVALLLSLATLGWLLRSTVRRAQAQAAWAALASAWLGAALFLWLAPGLLNPIKDMSGFMREVDARLPLGAAVYALNVDETLSAEIPFYTGRALVPLHLPLLPPLPAAVLVQNNHDGRAVSPGDDYQPQWSRAFGSGRALTLWQRPAGSP